MLSDRYGNDLLLQCYTGTTYSRIQRHNLLLAWVESDTPRPQIKSGSCTTLMSSLVHTPTKERSSDLSGAARYSVPFFFFFLWCCVFVPPFRPSFRSIAVVNGITWLSGDLCLPHQWINARQYRTLCSVCVICWDASSTVF